jgi:hypothetical protein
MTFLTTYQVRVGRPLPIYCDSPTVEGVIVYSFGSECQDVISCSLDQTVIRSSETCLRDLSEDAVFSANYRAHPQKINGQLAYTSTIQRKPVFSQDYACAVGSNNCFDT